MGRYMEHVQVSDTVRGRGASQCLSGGRHQHMAGAPKTRGFLEMRWRLGALTESDELAHVGLLIDQRAPKSVEGTLDSGVDYVPKN